MPTKRSYACKTIRKIKKKNFLKIKLNKTVLILSFKLRLFPIYREIQNFKND